MQQKRRFIEALIDRPQPRGIDALTTLRHFAIVTYAVPAERFGGLIHDRFQLEPIELNGQMMGLLSVVPFLDVDFTSAVFPFPHFTMGQTNYRIYVIDSLTGEHAVWFLGTTLDSWTCTIPRYFWRLPWYRGQVGFDCDFNQKTGLYDRYTMHTESDWAPAAVELTQSDTDQFHFPGFSDVESALVTLTHPLAGYYFRRDGSLGSYRVWHDELRVRPGQARSAEFGLLSRMGLVTQAEQVNPYSVLILPETEFTVYLPPRALT